MRMTVQGVGLLGGFGCGRDALVDALEAGSVTPQCTMLRDIEIPLYCADAGPLEEYLNKRALRRIDHFSRLALLGAFQALEDSGLGELDRSRIGVVLGSGFGALTTTFNFLDSVLNDGDACASPTAFSNSVHNAAAAHIAMQLKITGPTLTVSQFDFSTAAALQTASQWLAEERVDAVLLGMVDEYSPVLGYCWERYHGSPDDGRMTPFDFSHASAVPGEGAAFFMLQRADTPGSGGYACIDRVVMGNLQGSQPELNDERPLILACEGVPAMNRGYRDMLADEHQVACYSPLYGASPVTQGFDMAVAVLSLQRGRLFPSVAAGHDCPGRYVRDERECQRISCLRFGVSGEYGLIELSGQGG